MPVLQGNCRVLWLQALCSPVCDKQQLWEGGTLKNLVTDSQTAVFVVKLLHEGQNNQLTVSCTRDQAHQNGEYQEYSFVWQTKNLPIREYP